MLQTRKQESSYNIWSRNIFPVSMEGCVLYLPLWQEDMQGATLLSYEQYRRSCTVTGALWTPTGRDFAGVSDVITLPSHANWNLGSANFSVFCWAKADVNDTNRAIISRNGADANARSWCLIFNASAKFNWLASSTGNTWDMGFAQTGTFSANTWYLVGVARLGSDFTIYVNGVAGGTLSSGGTILNQDTVLKLGRDWDTGDPFLAGNIGEVWMFSRALTLAEILHIHEVTKRRYL